MPSIDDEEETLCLLAEQQQEDSPGPRQPASGGGGSVASYNQITPAMAWKSTVDPSSTSSGDKPVLQLRNDDANYVNQGDAFLAAGNAERAFFSVCGTNASHKRQYVLNHSDDDEAEDESDDEVVAQRRRLISDDADHDDEVDDATKSVRASIQVVNEILTDIEDDSDFRNQQQLQHPVDIGACDTFSSGNGTSRSLVVDVHLPPDDDGNMMSAVSTAASASVLSSSTSSSLRPYKHEMNRFQRCYSDGSQSSPKRKGLLSSRPLPPLQQQQHQQQADPYHRSTDEDSMQNIDRIETICETDPSSQSRSRRDRHSSECPTSGSAPTSTGFASIGFETAFRGFKFPEELLSLRQNLFDGRQIFFGSNSSSSSSSCQASKRKSDSDVLGANAPSTASTKYNDNTIVADKVIERPVSEHFQGQLPTSFSGGGGGGKSISGSRQQLRLSSPFTSFPSTVLANASVIPAPSSSSCATTTTTATAFEDNHLKKNGSSPYTFFTMESDDDFDFEDPEKNVDSDGAFDAAELSALKHFSTDFDDHKSTISQSSSTLSLPVCRICQLPSMEPNNHLISPCRCLGSIRYVHNNCLLKWLEVSSKRRSGPACCELCQYQYLRHKKFVISHWRFPECTLRDKILHFFFIISVCLMIGCAAVTIICFKEDRGPYRSPNKYHAGELSPPEMITLSCGVLFFLAFFLAMYVEVKARHTVYQLICKFFYLNHEWSVEEYDRKRDLVTTKKKKEKLKKSKRSESNDHRPRLST